MKLPRLWRVKRAGKEIGAFHVEIRGRRVNLRTQNPDEAKRRRLRAMKGDRKFEDDSDGTALKSLIAVVDGTGSTEMPPVVEPPPAEPAPPSVGAADAGGGAPPESGEYTPPPPDGSSWADAVNDAGGRAAGDTSSGSAAPGEGASGFGAGTKIPPDLIRQMLREAGRNIVMAQLALQALGVRWIDDSDVGMVPADNPGVKDAAVMWGDWLVTLVPDDWNIPPWIMAPAMTALFTLPVQLAGKTPRKHDETEAKTAPTSEATPAA